MVRVIVTYDELPDPDRYEQHAELCRQVPGITFRHGRVFGAPFGEPQFQYLAEMEFADMDAFKTATRSPEFQATGTDMQAMGVPAHVTFVELG